MPLNTKIRQIQNLLGVNETEDMNFEADSSIQKSFQDIFSHDAALFIGDNLNSLAQLVVTNAKSIDLCYIDPPYNTGSSFLYHDKRRTPCEGIYGSHGQWINFMLPRLVAARELLKSTGVIAVSIDDYECAYLKLLMDRIFGETNFIGNIVVCRSKNGKGSKQNLASNHEYLLVYGKSNCSKLRGVPDDNSAYKKSDQYGKFKTDGLFRKKGDASLRSDRPNMFYPLYYNPSSGEVVTEERSGWNVVFPKDSKGIERRWLWSKETAKKRAQLLYASKKGTIYVKTYADPTMEKRIKIRTLWTDTTYYTERATNELNSIFGDKVFDTPKPIEFIKTIIDSMAPSNATILDFFAGSGTTAHAAARLNLVDGGARKTILMEADDVIPVKHVAYKAGYRKISEITEKRLFFINKEIPGFSYRVIPP